MKRGLSLLLFAALAAVSAGCAFESSTTFTAPSSLPSGGSSGGSGGGGAFLMGLWASEGDIAIPSIDTCRDFSWEITSQTDTSVSGTFAAACGSSLQVTGSASGTLNDPTTVSISISGTALVAGLPLCPFSISGVGTLVDNDTLRIPYSGDTCLGPVSGTETLHRRKDPAPAPPPPSPDPPPPPPNNGDNPYHVPPGDLSYARAQEVVFATSAEFPGLTAPRGTESESRAAAEELLRRIIWHLHLAGFDAGRQRNPSGAISGDKLTIYINGSWHAFDVFIDVGTPGLPIRPAFTEVFPADHVPDGGIPD